MGNKEALNRMLKERQVTADEVVQFIDGRGKYEYGIRSVPKKRREQVRLALMGKTYAEIERITGDYRDIIGVGVRRFLPRLAKWTYFNRLHENEEYQHYQGA